MKWVSVKKGMPEDGAQVIVTGVSGLEIKARFKKTDSGPKFVSETDGIMIWCQTEVTHWKYSDKSK